MTTLVFFLEELSAKAMLEGLLPRLLPENVMPRYIVFEGKSDLEKQLEGKLRGWRLPDSRFVILRDQDSGDCRQIKEGLRAKCIAAGKPDALLRIACRELEGWYFGDPNAVEQAIPGANLSHYVGKAKYRVTDEIGSPSAELSAITGQAYQKVSGSRAIGPYLSLTENRSHSFQVFITGLKRLFLVEPLNLHRGTYSRG